MTPLPSLYDVAVVIPTLNEELHIADCLQSVIAQTFPFAKMDVMIVDGGSQDRTTSIVQHLSSQYSNIRLLHNPKRIQSAAFNMAVEHSSAPYIIRLDAHAHYEAHYIELCLHHLRSSSKIGNVGGIWNIQPSSSTLIARTNALLNRSRFGIGGASFRVGTQSGETDTVPFGAFPRTLIQEIGGMNEQLARGEDNEYNCRIHQAGYIVYLDTNIVSTYYSRPTFSSSIYQMYANGISIGQLIHKAPKSISLRHLVPLFFVLALLVCIIASLFYSPFVILLLVLMSAYTLANLIATLHICFCHHSFIYLLTLPVLFAAVHISYGVGTIKGLLFQQ